MSILMQQCVMTISPFPYVFSLEFFGENEKYTFLERSLVNLKINVGIFFKPPLAAILDFQNGGCFS